MENEIFKSADEYRGYFQEDEVALQEVVDRLKKLQAISDEQIGQLTAAMQGRGTQHYMIEHITNAIAIQSQMQSVLKDKRSIKERALDLALKSEKNNSEGSDAGDVIASVQAFLNEQKHKTEKNIKHLEEATNELANIDLDAEIEKKLGL